MLLQLLLILFNIGQFIGYELKKFGVDYTTIQILLNTLIPIVFAWNISMLFKNILVILGNRQDAILNQRALDNYILYDKKYEENTQMHTLPVGETPNLITIGIYVVVALLCYTFFKSGSAIPVILTDGLLFASVIFMWLCLKGDIIDLSFDSFILGYFVGKVGLSSTICSMWAISALYLLVKLVLALISDISSKATIAILKDIVTMGSMGYLFYYLQTNAMLHPDVMANGYVLYGIRLFLAIVLLIVNSRLKNN